VMESPAGGGSSDWVKNLMAYVYCGVTSVTEFGSYAENFEALIGAINKSKPPATKGVYLKKVSVSSTMGVGIRVDHSTLTGASAGSAQ